MFNCLKNPGRIIASLVLTASSTLQLLAQTNSAPEAEASASLLPSISINAGLVKHKASPLLYGIMTEEINYSYEGGLYAELIRNRSFHEVQGLEPNLPRFWSLVHDDDTTAVMSLDSNQPFNEAHPASLMLRTGAAPGHPVRLANTGFWGVPAKPSTTYKASFYAKAAPGFKGPITVSIETHDGFGVLASAQVTKISSDWKKYTVSLAVPRSAKPSVSNDFVISVTNPGTVWLSMVSLFPPTWNNRANGLRPDIMQLLADLKPTMLRFPGGNYVEGNTLSNRFDWKKTVGPVEERPGHRNDGWGYWSTDGMGLLEFLTWCEDLKMEPVLAVFAGLTLNHRIVEPGEALQPYVQDALNEIEYVTGDVNTKWGAQRAKDGHPEPFALRYVEIGNEDYDKNCKYDERFTQFYDAIKATYPNLKLIATVDVTSRKADLRDDHAYFDSSATARAAATKYDNADRNGPKILFGEYASQTTLNGIAGARPATPNLLNALDDAAFLTGLERNSDIVEMTCYAPLFVNMNPGGVQWKTDLIGYNALDSFGSVSYYLQVMWNTRVGDAVLESTLENAPTEMLSLNTRRGQPAQQQQTPTLFHSVTKNTAKGMVFLKVVNTSTNAQSVQIKIDGAKRVASTAKATVLTSTNLLDGNSLAEPKKVVPRTKTVKQIGSSFNFQFEPSSVTILELKTK